MTHEETIAALCSLRNHGSKFGIDRMRELSKALGSPQNAFHSIHLAGTNGKGSTAAMIESILRGNGLRVGLYTSPHLVKLGERVQVQRVPLSDAKICSYAEELWELAKVFGKPGDDDYPSFFEFMTATAFLHFKRERCDAAVIETGLGGRLDATNVLAPKVCVITSIGLDHCDMLGTHLEEIAREKAGIIKEKTPVVLSIMPDVAEREIRRIAEERGAPVISVREQFGDDVRNYPETNLCGNHQRRNAAAATLATEAFCEATSEAGITGCGAAPHSFSLLAQRGREGTACGEDSTSTFLKNVNWAARWDTRTLADGQTIVIDVAHNAECAVVLSEMLEAERKATGARPTVVVGVLGVERARPILHAAAEHAEKLILVRPAQERACTLEELRGCVPQNFTGPVEESTVTKLFPRPNFCSEKPANGGKLIVSGSCYLAGEALAALEGTKPASNLQDKL